MLFAERVAHAKAPCATTARYSPDKEPPNTRHARLNSVARPPRQDASALSAGAKNNGYETVRPNTETYLPAEVNWSTRKETDRLTYLPLSGLWNPHPRAPVEARGHHEAPILQQGQRRIDESLGVSLLRKEPS